MSRRLASRLPIESQRFTNDPGHWVLDPQGTGEAGQQDQPTNPKKIQNQKTESSNFKYSVKCQHTKFKFAKFCYVIRVSVLSVLRKYLILLKLKG